MKFDLREQRSGLLSTMYSDEVVEIDVIVNHEVKSQMKCVDFRPNLAGWRVPRCGYIGFHPKSVSLKSGDRVEIRDNRYGLILDSVVV